MNVLVLLAGLPLPVLLALVIGSFLFLSQLLLLIAIVPAASDRIVRFIRALLGWYYQIGNRRPHRRLRQRRGTGSGH